MRIFASMMKPVIEDKAKYSKIDPKNKIGLIDNYFIFAMVWSMGGSIVTEYRKKFDTQLRRLFEGDIKFEDETIKTKKIALAFLRG